VRAPGAWGPRPLQPRRHWLAVRSGQGQARPFPARARRRRGWRQLARHPSDRRGRRMAGLQAACSTGAGMGGLPSVPASASAGPEGSPTGRVFHQSTDGPRSRAPCPGLRLLLARPGGQGGRLAHTRRSGRTALPACRSQPAAKLHAVSSADCCSSDPPRLCFYCATCPNAEGVMPRLRFSSCTACARCIACRDVRTTGESGRGSSCLSSRLVHFLREQDL